LDGIRKRELSVKILFNHVIIALATLSKIDAQIKQFAGIQPQKLLSFWLIIRLYIDFFGYIYGGK
jgi:hypothetical protein